MSGNPPGSSNKSNKYEGHYYVFKINGRQDEKIDEDDFLTKPFNPKELDARLKNILRRIGKI